MQDAIDTINGQGLLGALLIVGGFAIWKLYARIQHLHDQARDDGREQTRALLSAAAATDRHTEALKENTAVLGRIVSRGG